MKDESSETPMSPWAKPMAFYHSDGLVPAYKQATKFAGAKGHLATLPEIMEARLNTPLDSETWHTWHVSLSAEYVGRSAKTGKLILIVAHGIGPMSNLDGILKAYSWEYKDKTRKRNGGRITQEEFWKLEAGQYGPVAIVDFKEYMKRYGFPFMQGLRVSQLAEDSVYQARLGPVAVKYALTHQALAQKWHLEEKDNPKESRPVRARHVCDAYDPYILEIRDPNNCSYRFWEPEAGYALAHLLSVGPVMSCIGLQDEDGRGHQGLVAWLNCQEWNGPSRFVAMPEGSKAEQGIHPGPDPFKLLQAHWQELLESDNGSKEFGLRRLTKVGEQWFITDQRIGDEFGGCEAQNPVVSMKTIGDPTPLKIKISGCYGIFRWSEDDIRSVAPKGANAFDFVGEAAIEDVGGNPTFHNCTVQFYEVQIDPTKKLMDIYDLGKDYDKQMSLLFKEK